MSKDPTKKTVFRSRCGQTFQIKVSTLSVWGSDITCEACGGRQD